MKEQIANVAFHLHKVLILVKFIESEIRKCFQGVGGERNRELLIHADSFRFTK
jgi:hypothetical protein